MTLERPTIDASEQKHLDDPWYQEYQDAAQFEELGLLNGSVEFRKIQKADFFNGEVENPSLDYPKLENFDFGQKEQALLDLKKRILAEENNDAIKQIYRWKLNERIAKLRSLEATRNGNDRKALHYSKFVYGSPEKNIYEYTIYQIKQVVDGKLFSPDPEISAAATRLNK